MRPLELRQTADQRRRDWVHRPDVAFLGDDDGDRDLARGDRGDDSPSQAVRHADGGDGDDADQPAVDRVQTASAEGAFVAGSARDAQSVRGWRICRGQSDRPSSTSSTRCRPRPGGICATRTWIRRPVKRWICSSERIRVVGGR